MESNNFIGNYAGEAATPFENGGYANAGSGTQALRGNDGSDGTGGAFFASAESTGLHFNRILDNGLPDVAGGTGVIVDATNNWWGTNFEGTNPLAAGRVSTLVDADPWVMLRLIVPSPIYNGIPVQFIADLTQNSDGNPFGGIIPNGVQANFTATRGNVVPTQNNTVSGQATTTYTPTSSGSATFTTKVDYQTVTVNQNVEPRAVLIFTKVVSNEHPNYGDTIHFIITVQNVDGPDNATGVSVFNQLPDGLVYVTSSASVGSYSNITKIWTIGTLNVGSGALLDITALVNATGHFNNTATLTQTTYPQDAVNRSAILNVDPAAIISLTKTDNTTNHKANVGDLVTFTITTHNAGPDTAHNVIITDVLPLGLDFVSASDSGTYDPISRTITWAAFDLNYGAPDVNRTFNATVNAIMAGNITGIINTANATFTEFPSVANGTDTAIYVPLADMYINSWASKTNPYVGEIITITFKVGNRGPDTAQNVVFTLPIPDGMEFIDVTVDGGLTPTYDPITRTLTWNLGDVVVGDPTALVRVRVLRAGSFVFAPSLSTDTYDPNLESSIQIVTVNAQNVPEANAQTVGMQNTGVPIAQLVLAVLLVLGGFLLPKRK